MDENKLIITYDFGTQSARCMIVDQKGNILAIDKEKYKEPYYSLKMGYCEQSFDVYWEYACKASQALKENNKELFDKAIGVTVTTFRDTYTCTDENGKPIRDFILWLDSRKAKCEKPMPFKQKLIFGLVGMNYPLQCQRQMCRQTWIKENEPEIWEKTKKFGSISAVINAKLTGNYSDSTASTIGHIPFDYINKCWMGPKGLTFPIYNLETDKLTNLVNPLDIVGYITEEASKETGLKKGLPLIATGSDKGCETLGSGVMNDYSGSLSFGTSVTIQYSLDKYVEPSAFLPAYPAVNPKLFNPEIQIYRGCWMISWFIQNFARREQIEAEEKGVATEVILNEYIKEVPLGCNGLILLPHWNPPLKLPEARGTIMGFIPDHNKYYLYRAIIEGMGYTLYDAYLQLEKRTKHHTKYFVISGGGSNSDEICQIVCDILGIELKRTKETEASGIGSSICGFVGLNVYKNFEEAVKNMVSYNKTFTPDKENHEKYLQIFNKVYKRIYPQIRPVYKNYLKIDLEEK